MYALTCTCHHFINAVIEVINTCLFVIIRLKRMDFVQAFVYQRAHAGNVVLTLLRVKPDLSAKGFDWQQN